ncbi:MAG: extracellular solute-binding protein [Treponema sp.]|nr:extracellular solute-binding protein [Treponema sp.]
MLKKIVIICLILMPIFIMSCNKNAGRGGSHAEQGRSSGTVTIPEAPEEIRNTLKGMNIVIGNWWNNYDPAAFRPRNDLEERQLEHHKWLLQEYEFSMQDKNIGGWGEISQLATTSIMAGKPAATIFRLQADWALALYRQNLLYPVSNSKAVDWNAVKPIEWNRHVANAFTFDNKTYAFTVGYGSSGSAAAVFWNKRLFREAGLDPNLLYDLQKNGTWTWDKYLEICKQLTRDINNDGIIDTYAMPCDFSVDILDALVAGNAAMFVDRDASGKLVNATNRPEFIEAIRFYMRLKEEGVMKPKPEGIHWDWFVSEFIDGNVAMRIAPQHSISDMRTMRDDWGIVLPPKGPRAKNYVVFSSENVMVIPSRGYTDEQVDAILWAIQAWAVPLDDDWRINQYANFRDRRAVDETMTMIRDQSLWQWRYHTQVPGFSTGGIAWELWWHEGEPAQLVESVSQSWNALINDANGL